MNLRDEAIQGTIDWLCRDCNGFCPADLDCVSFWAEVEEVLEEWNLEEGGQE